MAEADWTIVPNSLTAGVVASGVSAGLGVPSGGGTHVHGWKSLTAGTTGVHARRANQAGFAPFTGTNGGQVTFAVRRKEGAATDMAVFCFIQLQSDDVNAGDGYIFGISAGDPGVFMLRKGALIGGLPDVAVGTNGVLRRSTETVLMDEWRHLRIDVISNPSGDVLLRCWKSDLNVNDVTSPAWAAIPGMDEFNDDALGVNSGSPGLDTGGYAGMGFYMANAGVVGTIDHVEIGRET